ncbi:MAG: PAS domain S-box protein [Proteobacteria bacterium]|nr:PAS domain S-box protein [Pseudomonadota bacterium]
MNPFALISLFSFVFCVCLGASIYFRNSRAIVNKLYMQLCLVLATCALIEFGYRQSHNYAEASFWWRLDFFWPLIAASAIHFAIAITEKISLLKSRWIYGIIYGPTLMFMFVDAKFHLITGNPIKQFWGWSYSIPDNIIGKLGYAWIFISLGLSLYLLLKHSRSISDNRKQKQCKLIALGLFLGMSSQIMESVFNLMSINFPPFFITSIIVINTLIAYAIWKYELFALTPITAAESIVATMSDTLLLVNNNRTIESCNKATTELLGYKQNDLSGALVETVFFEYSDIPAWILDTDIDSPKERVKYLDTRLRTSDDRDIPVSLASSLLNDERGNRLGFLLIARDITERKNKEQELNLHRHHLEKLVTQRTQDLDATNQELARSREQLRLLSERLVLAKEEESARIARELHDELGQILTGLKIDISLFDKHLKKKMWSNQKEYEARIESILGLVDNAIKGVQGITKGLRPAMLDDIGLVATVEWMIGEFNRRIGIECSFYHRVNDEDYDSAFSTAVYRIIQESLTNVVRHSNAEDAFIKMKETEKTLQVFIEDNGIGIKDEEVSGLHSVGILGMTERAYTFGGQVNIKGLRGRGTSVQLSVPIVRLKNATNIDCR